MEKLKGIFEAAPLIRFPAKVVHSWQEAGIDFWDNNGWRVPGSAYILHAEHNLEDLETELDSRQISWRDYAIFRNGYVTIDFGLPGDVLEAWLDDETLIYCERVMARFGIEWSGWPGYFMLLADEEQLVKLVRHLNRLKLGWPA